MPERLLKAVLICMSVLLAYAQNAKAQQGSTTAQITISGSVLSAGDAELLIGVNVIRKGTSEGTVTDVDGAFTMLVPSDGILVFSYIGYQEQEVAVNGRTSLQIYLEKDSKLLDEVIVTGYRRETRSTVSSAISSVKAERIEKLPVLGFERASTATSRSRPASATRTPAPTGARASSTSSTSK
jgi:hypothetical protein